MERDLNPAEFQRFHDLIYALAGIHYPAEKAALLSNRLRRRLRATQCPTYEVYLQAVSGGKNPAETQAFLDSITTNETYFFRCKRHWDYFKAWLTERNLTTPLRQSGLRIWSAAASNGAEAYSICVTLHQMFGDEVHRLGIQILATDLSQSVLQEAREGIYSQYALSQTPVEIQQRYFTKRGTDEFEFSPKLRKLVSFEAHNLMHPLLGRGQFDFIFLRNVMIYFDLQSKEKVMQNAFAVARPGAHLLVGESESLMNLTHPFTYVKPSLFRKPGEMRSCVPMR